MPFLRASRRPVLREPRDGERPDHPVFVDRFFQVCSGVLMANDAVVDKGRRRFLTATTSVVGGAGVALAAIPFVKSWEPSEKA
jgi:hypothetical protein